MQQQTTQKRAGTYKRPSGLVRRPLTSSGNIFKLNHKTAFPTLTCANALWLNSMRVPLERQDLFESNASCEIDTSESPLEVNVLLRISANPSVLSTESLLTIKISPTCTKTFEFAAGAPVQIPRSVRRPTAITITAVQSASSLVPSVPAAPSLGVTMFLIDFLSHQTTAMPDITLMPDHDAVHIVYAVLKTATGTLGFKFPCWQYKRDMQVGHYKRAGGDKSNVAADQYEMRHLFADFARLQRNPIIVPASRVNIVSPKEARYIGLNVQSSKEARAVVNKLESAICQLKDILDDASRSTALYELGATEDNATEIMQSVNWQRSYSMATDDIVSKAIVITRDIYVNLVSASNMAVDGKWLPDSIQKAKTNASLWCQLLCTRKDLASRIEGRRSDLDSVMRVRTCFLLISAIDHTLRSVCRKNTFPTPFCANDVSCHDYWLGQMKSNMHNSISMEDGMYNEARSILALCKQGQECALNGLRLLPEADMQLSDVSQSVWNNMHLQGLCSDHALIVASAPHMLYKQQTFIDFDAHPFVMAVMAMMAMHALSPTEQTAEQTAEQTESAKLFAILVSNDVENRVIHPCVLELIKNKWEIACSGRNVLPHSLSSCTTEQKDAVDFIHKLFHPEVRSLISCGLGLGGLPEIDFLAHAYKNPPTTGYDDMKLTALVCEHVLRLEADQPDDESTVV